MQAAAVPSVSPRAAYAQRGTNTLQHVFRDHFASFAADYDVRYAKELGNFRIKRISRVATRFLTCSDYRQGVARIRVEDRSPGRGIPPSENGSGGCISTLR